MQLAINIDESDYKTLMINGGNCSLGMAERIVKSVYQGEKLPKGHGALKDMGNLQYVFDLTREEPIYSGKDIEWAIKSMTTIIEADKEE